MEWKFVEPSGGHFFVELTGKSDVVRVAHSRYFVLNNVWGADTPQTIRVDVRNGDFTIVHAEHSARNRVAAYPAIIKGNHWELSTTSSGMPIKVGKLISLLSSWSFTPVDSGRWSAAYDLWFSPLSDSKAGYPGGTELMLWLDRRGAVPDGSPVTLVTINDIEWEIWFEKGKREWAYVVYVSSRPVYHVDNFNLLEFVMDCVARGWIEKDWYLHAVEAGFELWEGGVGLASSNFSVLLG
ncbi:MAG: glycoside hydrolase [Anaerolineae bacterium]|nr:glycoside hydrolase [Anaerolineae bacterium]MDW8102044.1 glycoside hydrolase [Anaerolineae bacterium]